MAPEVRGGHSLSRGSSQEPGALEKDGVDTVQSHESSSSRDCMYHCSGFCIAFRAGDMQETLVPARTLWVLSLELVMAASNWNRFKFHDIEDP